MKLLKVGNGKYVNADRITHIEAERPDKVAIIFQTKVSGGEIGIPPSYVELKASEAEDFLRWLETNSQGIR